MNREDAHERLSEVIGSLPYVNWHGTHEFLDEIFNSFESREKELFEEIDKLKNINSGLELPTKELLSEIFEYKDGELLWKIKRSGTKGIGTIAGSIYNDGYRVATVNGNRYGVHRLIWILHNDFIQDGCEIDHIDGNRLNNNISNLRCVNRKENSFNKTTSKGYCWDKSVNKWKAYITIDGKGKHLGHFDTENDAESAYLKAKNKYHNIGITQTCDSCKYLKSCFILDSLNSDGEDFGCNKWQPKN